MRRDVASTVPPRAPCLAGREYGIIRGMIHRHIIEGETLSLTAIDDIIDRGSPADWRELKARACVDSSLLTKIIRVCAVKIADPYAQRYHLWNYYAQHAVA